MKDNPYIEWAQVKNRECLKFTFREKLTKNDAERAIEQWKQLFDKKKDEKITLVWDCHEMTGYEPLARMKWQKAMKELQNQINDIWLVSDSEEIQAGAKMMALFTSMDINYANIEDKILKFTLFW